MRRRRFGVLAVGGLVGTSGCLEFVTGERAAVFEADPAATNVDVASDAGYRTDGPRELPVERSFGVAGESRTVRVVNQVTTYEKRLPLPLVEDPKLGVFSLISSPSVEVAGEEFNPLGEYSNDRLLEMIRSSYGGFRSVERVSSREETVLGTETTVTKYTAKAPVNGASLDVYLHVTKVRHEDDYVVALGVYPRRFVDEEANLLRMMRAIIHPA
jgi:hypothetical protein